MKNLTYRSESAFLEHSKRIASKLPNMKLSTIRKAMAEADNFRTIDSYRKALRILGDDVKPSGSIISEAGILTVELKAGLPYGLERYNSESEQEDLLARLGEYLGGNNWACFQDIDTIKLENGEFIISGAFKLDYVEKATQYAEREEEILEHLFMSPQKSQFTAFTLAEDIYKAALHALKSAYKKSQAQEKPEVIANHIKIPILNDNNVVNCLSKKLSYDCRVLAVRQLQAKNAHLHEDKIIERQAENAFLLLCRETTLLLAENYKKLSTLPEYEENSTFAFMLAKRIVIK